MSSDNRLTNPRYTRTPVLPVLTGLISTTIFFNCCANAHDSSGSYPVYSQVVSNLKKASIPIKELHGRGQVTVTLAAGRIVALAFSEDGPDLLWSNPKLGNTALIATARRQSEFANGDNLNWT